MVRRTHQQFIDEIRRIHPNLEILSEYVKVTERVLVRCLIHDFTFYAIPDNLLRGKGCRLCGYESIAKRKKKDFGAVIKAFEERGIILLSTEDEIVDLSKTHLRYLCPFHGEQDILWNNFKRGAGCRKCADEANSLRMRQETWAKIQDYFKSSEYVLLSTFEEYTGANESCLRCLCEKHGEFSISWTNLNKFEGCPICNSSAGERRIFHYLYKHNINFCRVKTFDDLIGVGGKKLSYDFYLPQLNLLIEHQGEQHEHPVVFPNMSNVAAVENFKKQQEHDKRKKQYAIDHNINLLEIWYYEFDVIEDILDSKIKR